MNPLVNNYKQSTSRPVTKQSHGNWVPAEGVSHYEPMTNAKAVYPNYQMEQPRQARNSPGKHRRTGSWASADAQVNFNHGGNTNQSFAGGYNNTKPQNSQTLKAPRSNDYSMNPQNPQQQFYEQPQPRHSVRTAKSMIEEDIEEESETPLKPHQASRRFSNLNPNFHNLATPEDHAKLAKNQNYHDMNALLSGGTSTGLSGNESTPTHTIESRFKFGGNLHHDFLGLSDGTLESDFEHNMLAVDENLLQRPDMDFEQPIYPGYISQFGQEIAQLEHELANFDPFIDPCGFDAETIEFLTIREKEYNIDPHYIKTRQPNVTWIMRAILVDWLFEVSMEFTLKRETFHYALNYFDRFLSLSSNVQKQDLQLIGVAALYIAAKTEEIFSFRVADFAKSCDGAYTEENITNMEMVMLKTLRWMLVPPTLNTWAQWYLSQWDLFIEKSPYAIGHPLIANLGNEGWIQFKQPNEQSYSLFREIMQYIDAMVLEVEHLQYNKRTLVAGLMYLVLGKHYQQFTVQDIFEQIQFSSMCLLDKTNAFNDLFAEYLSYIFGFQMEELLPSVQYAAGFFKLQLSFDMPRAAQLKGGDILEGHFEEFLSYQTHHQQALDFVKRKAKGMI